MHSPQLAEAYCDRVYEQARREKVSGVAGSKASAFFAPGRADPGDYDIYLNLVQVQLIMLQMLCRVCAC